MRKQVAIDDFLAAAEFLIGQRYTRPSSLGIAGHGFGGLLVGAAATQRPDLFGAVVADDGLFDMSRFSRFTVGSTWVPEFGTPDRSTDLRALLAYSPLHNVRPETHYPATLITAGARNREIVPIHSLKFAAALQAAQVGPAPILLRVDPDAGDPGAVPTTRQIAASTDRLSFLLSVLKALK